MPENSKFPILLIPGVIAPAYGKFWEYFYKIPQFLTQELGYKVYVCPLPKWGDYKTRSEILKNFIQKKLPQQKFHIIAHSKGGVEARYLLEQNLFLDQIASFTSISCPYNGSTAASFFYKLFYPLKWLSYFKPLMDSLYELQPRFYQKLWTKNENDYSFPIKYVCAQIPKPILFKTYPLFWLTSYLINKNEGSNDGFVSKQSTQFGTLIAEYKTDHIGLIGQFYGKTRGFSYIEVYRKILD